MADLFEEKNISPMLLYEVKEPFDDKDYIYELKLDGIRCIAYIEPNSCALQNKRFKDLTPVYPELSGICNCVKKRVILDGELVVLTDGKPDFYALQRRSLMTDGLRISIAAKRNPVQFVAYDLLYFDGKDLTAKPLTERKEILSKNVKEGFNLSISRYVSTCGVAFFELAERENLEGIVAKRKDGLYHIGRRTREWLKVKVMRDEDLLVLGYMPDGEGIKYLILGGYDENGVLQCRGKVSLGVSKAEQKIIKDFAKRNTASSPLFEEYKNAVWLKPELTGTVIYMQQTQSGAMRQPVWKGLRDDK